VFNVALRVYNCLGHASIINNISSTYCMVGKSFIYPTCMGTLSRPNSIAFLIMDWSMLATHTNSRGERGSLSLTPFLQWNIFPGTPFRSTDDVLEVRIPLIHVIHCLGILYVSLFQLSLHVPPYQKLFQNPVLE
jgi:hypothetical protein